MKFSREYTKLQDRVFSTIRHHCAYDEGQIIRCDTPHRVFHARVLLKVSIRFRNIPLALLQYDTDGSELSAAEIIDEIRALYRSDPPGPDDIMTIYWLEQVRS